MELTPHLHAFLWTSPQQNNCNTYLLRSDTRTILIDPGHAALFDHVRRHLDALEIAIDDIDLVVCTHAHPDHIEAIRFFAPTKARFALHAAEWQLVTKMAPYIQSAMGLDVDTLAPDFFLDEGALTVGDLQLAVYHTPGHSPGSITLYWADTGALFTGDLIFKEGLGRTDLPGGSGEQLKASIRRMGTLDAAWLLSGHGAVVSGREAVKANFRQVETAWFGYV